MESEREQKYNLLRMVHLGMMGRILSEILFI